MTSTNTTSNRRIVANRRNAQLSTGPRTVEGKARVAQNRTTHALTGQGHTILPGEDAEAYDRLLATLMEEHAPYGETETHQVELLAHNQWKLRRAARLENEAFEDSLSPETGRFALTDAVMRAARYMASIRRSYTLALAELHRLQSARAKAGQPLSPFSPRNESNPIAVDQSPDSGRFDLGPIPVAQALSGGRERSQPFSPRQRLGGGIQDLVVAHFVG